MNESSLTKDRRKRLLIHLNPCIPSNVTPKTTISDQDGPSPNGRLRLRESPEPEPFATSPGLAEYKLFSPREKFRIATM
jgi:hypothetical protein